MKRIDGVEVCAGKWNDIMGGVFIHKIVAYYIMLVQTHVYLIWLSVMSMVFFGLRLITYLGG